MCGIAGFFSGNSFCSEDELHLMTDSMLHRGPDASGYYFNNNIGLGHRRLSIIDLSVRANQPMTSQDGRYIMVYNGEVYNFAEIASELKTNLQTTSDTEVILEAFIQFGPDFVNRLNGMFAFAIYDKHEDELYLYRDRMGIKPIFYYYDDNKFAFASELKALLKLDTINANKEINKEAIVQFLNLGYIPQPHTIYKNIYKFPSGSYLKITKDLQPEIKAYWRPEDKIKAETITDYYDAKVELDELLNKSVKYRLISDVPYGVFLSGGIDSSIVTAIARKQTSSSLKTFSIGFKESKYNESNYAREVSDFLQTDHHEFIVSQKDSIALIDDILNSYDEPYSDSSALPTMLVSKLARENVTMVLSGDGGDELFYGYGAYVWAKRLSKPYVKLFRKPIGNLLSRMNNRSQRAAGLFMYDTDEHLKSNIFSQEQCLFSLNELDELMTDDYNFKFELDEHYDELGRILLPEEQQSLFDLKYYLKDDLLVKVDRASMKYSLETRVPLLDYNVVEFALNLSPELKIKNGVQKYLLKELLYDYIPKSYFDRPKWGFSIPLSEWLREELYFLIEDYLSESIIKQFNFVNYEVVEKLKNDFLYNDKTYLYNRIWALILLHKWVDRYF